jgi:hypothetical protein
MEQSAIVSKEYLRRISTALLSRVVRTRDFNCDAMRTLGREILTNNVSTTYTCLSVCFAVNCQSLLKRHAHIYLSMYCTNDE